MQNNLNIDRYKHDGDFIIVEIVVKNSRLLYNNHDPAPFRERDLDIQFVNYFVAAIEEFSIKTKMKLRILTSDPNDLKPENSLIIQEAIKTYFQYETSLTHSKIKKRTRRIQTFFFTGILTLFICLTAAQFLNSIKSFPKIANMMSVGFMITGWVAMWHPIESLLYEGWPIREQKRFFEKMSNIEVEIALDPQTHPSEKVI